MSLIEETIAWAERHGFDVPGFEPNGQTTLEVTLQQIQKAEESVLAEVEAIDRALQARMLKPEDEAKYQAATWRLYQSQLTLYRELQNNPMLAGARQLGLMSAIPVPQRAPSLSGIFQPSNMAGSGVAGLGALPAIGAAGWAAIVLGVVTVVGVTIAITTSSASEAYQADVYARAHEDTIAARLAVYNDCLQRGQLPDVCRGIAAGLIPDVPPPPGAEDTGVMSKLKTGVLWIGGGLLVVGAGYAAFRYYTGRPVRGYAGLGSASGPKRLRGGLDDPYPSNYYLEID